MSATACDGNPNVCAAEGCFGRACTKGSRLTQLTPDGYDERGEYVGPCPACGTDHGGVDGPGTLRGQLACMRVRAAALGDDDLIAHIDMGRVYVNVAQANALGLPSELDEA